MGVRAALCLLMLSACDGSGPEAAPAAQASTGGEDATPERAEMAVQESVEEVTPSGPSTFTLTVMVKGEATAATISLLAADGNEVANGASGQPILAQLASAVPIPGYLRARELRASAAPGGY